MKNGLYRKLAWNNIRKNQSTFLPFGIVASCVVAVFYMIFSISAQSDAVYQGEQSMEMILKFGTIVVGIVAAVILLYTNRFVMKQRTKEFGLYNILGLEKKHIAKVIFWETAIVGLGSILIGLLAGMLFSKLLFLIFINMLGLKSKIPFRISYQVLAVSIGIFALIFAINMFFNDLRIARLKPVEMLRESAAGEKEPKAKWVIALLGVVMVAAGYYISVTTENPMKALNLFFVAVLLVILGTYCLFMAGSIAFLKLLKKNKKFYYHKTHFVNVSGMLFRMKQNAMGLASICVLSTIVIVTLLTTISLFVGIDDERRVRYPKDVDIRVVADEKVKDEKMVQQLEQRGERAREAALRLAGKQKVKIKAEEVYTVYEASLFWKNNRFYMDQSYDLDTLVNVSVMTVRDYNAVTKTKYKATKGKYIVLTNKDTILYGDDLQIGEQTFACKQKGLIDLKRFADNYSQQLFILVPDTKDMLTLQHAFEGLAKHLMYSGMKRKVTFDLSGSKKAKTVYGSKIGDWMETEKVEGISLIEDYYTTLQTALNLYASVFFIGIFIGIIFLGATVLIIYYKQVSEGYEDRKNFRIMAKIGLSNQEINQMIRSQIRLVFLLLLLVAGMHICFAYPIIRKIMAMMNLTNEKLFVMATVGTCLVFAGVYLIVYKLTSRVYYRLVGTR